MIKDLNNVDIIEVEINDTDKEIVKDGDIVAYNYTANEWVLCKSSNTFTDAVFGVVCDTNDKSKKRLICLNGFVETNIAEAGHKPFEMLFFNAQTNYLRFTTQNNKIPNAVLVKYLPSRYGQIRGLVKLQNNISYTITLA